MARSRADSILHEFEVLARGATRPPLPSRPVATTTRSVPALPGLAMAALAVLAVTVWLGLPGPSGGPLAPSASADVGATSSTSASAPPAGPASIPRCEDVPAVSAPEAWYRDTPIYVANEQPTEELRAWAQSKPGFEGLWLDRDHLGWIALAFSQDAELRQAELREQFPDVGVVAVPVDWTAAELDALRDRVAAEMRPLLDSWSLGTSVTQGVVALGVGVLTPERIALVEDRYAGERICLEGVDPASVPAPGPQPQQGDGWRLLLDRKATGQPYRTGIAWDQASYERLWREIGLSPEPAGALPPVDFESEVAIWFGAVYGGSCPGLRLDDVVVDEGRAMVHAVIVLVDPPAMCTADANPHAYVVALERARLPRGPFAIQLGAEDPPGGVPEERTIVDVDLSGPGATAEPGDIRLGTPAPDLDVLGPGAVVEPGFEARYRQPLDCGIEWLGPLNGIVWRTDVPVGTLDFVPPAWQGAVEGEQSIVLTILLDTGPPPSLSATANGHSVTYEASLTAPGPCQ